MKRVAIPGLIVGAFLVIFLFQNCGDVRFQSAIPTENKLALGAVSIEEEQDPDDGTTDQPVVLPPTTTPPVVMPPTTTPPTSTPPTTTPPTTGNSRVSNWIINHFTGVSTIITGTHTRRLNFPTPALVVNADISGGKYGLFPEPVDTATDTRVGFVNVRIHDLVSTDAYGGGIGASKDRLPTTWFLSNVTVDPNWPMWVSYSTTNYDGLTLDNVDAVYGSSVTIRRWNADGAIDNKANVSQFSKLDINGAGHRGIRYWGAGPHYLVESSLVNTMGSLLWIRNCSTFVLNVYRSTFNGQNRIPVDKIECDLGSNPQINYLTVDPRRNGSMHEMFSQE